LAVIQITDFSTSFTGLQMLMNSAVAKHLQQFNRLFKQKSAKRRVSTGE
jgi:hypothetical protein